MPNVDWSIRGPQISTGNCNWGCPCRFNALPTRGHCRAGLLAWPKAIHEGNGEVLAIVDESAGPAQREAALKILTGEQTEPGATIFNVLAATFAKVHEPLFKPIEFELHIEDRSGRFRVPGVIEAEVEPIRNPVTGAAQYASSKTRASGAIPLDWSAGPAHLFTAHFTPRGPLS